MNLFAPPRYDERITGLAIGVECVDTLSGRPVPDSVVTVESFTVVPRAGVASDATVRPLLPSRLRRQRDGRHALRWLDVYDRVSLPAAGDGLPGFEVVLRVEVERTGRQLVPRRVRVEAPPLDGTSTPGGGVPGVGANVGEGATRRIHLHPGVGAAVPPGATVVHGTVVDGGDPTVAMPWARAVARDSFGDVVGWAHGDDRGELVLVVTSPELVTGTEMDVEVEAAADAPLPAGSDDPLDHQLVEDVPATATPDDDPAATGRRLDPARTRRATQPLTLPVGRATTTTFSL